MDVRIESNAKQLQTKYYRRAAVLERTARTKPMAFAVALSAIRRRNLQTMIYDKTPYIDASGSKRPTFRLLEGERVLGNMVFNDAPYAAHRMRMKGEYARDGGTSREANWGPASILQFIPAMRLQQTQMNRRILEG